MQARQIITEAFENQIKDMFKDKESIKTFILNHERKNLCIDNMVTEVKKTELGSAFNLERRHLELMGKEYAKTFSKAALDHAEQSTISQVEKQRRINKAQEREEVARMFQDEDRSESI